MSGIIRISTDVHSKITFFRSAVAVILRISHGYAIEPEGPDPLVDIAEKGIAQISMAAQPGAFVVDAIPIRKSLRVLMNCMSR